MHTRSTFENSTCPNPSTTQEEAYLAYAERRFQDAVDLLTRCIAQQPGEPRWREMRAEVREVAGAGLEPGLDPGWGWG